MSDEVQEALEKIFSADSEIYQNRGFQRRIGFGKRPALINIDLANAWTRPDNAFSCDHMDVIIPAVQDLLTASRAKNVPVVYTSTAYAVTDGPNSDMGLWHHKIPAELLQLGSEDCEIDDRIAPQSGEQVIYKKRASAFHGTYLAGFLRSLGVDTVIITGVTMAGCVRHTTEDAIAEGFPPDRGSRGRRRPCPRCRRMEPVRHRRQIRGRRAAGPRARLSRSPRGPGRGECTFP